MSVTLPDGTVITDDTSPTTGLKAGGHRTRFYPCLSAIATWAGQVQAWAAQAQAAAGAGGGTIFPTVNINNAGQSLVLNSAGTAYIADASAKGFRNKIINGDFQIWQGGTSFTNPTNSATAYCADQWLFYRSGFVTGITATQQQTQTASKGVRIQRTAGDTSTLAIYFSHVFETLDVVKLAGKTVTLQCKVKKGGNYSESSSLIGATAYYGTGTDGNLANGFIGTSVIGSTTPIITTSLQQITFTFTIPSNATQFTFSFSYWPTGTAGANDWFEITDVQLEEGSVATPFERRPYWLELSLCQRYYEKSYSDTVVPGTNTVSNAIVCNSMAALTNLGYYNSVTYKVQKRVAPTLTLYSAAGSLNKITLYGGAEGAANSLVDGGLSHQNGFTAQNTSGATISVSNAYYYHFVASARL